MTVKEAVRLLPDNEKVKITYSGNAYELDRRDPMMLDAYGDYLIDGLQAFPNGDFVEYELIIALRPIRA